MEIKLFCTIHGDGQAYEVFKYIDEAGQTAVECVLCVAESILRDYSDESRKAESRLESFKMN